jgi:hypothetical protein
MINNDSDQDNAGEKETEFHDTL